MDNKINRFVMVFASLLALDVTCIWQFTVLLFWN